MPRRRQFILDAVSVLKCRTEETELGREAQLSAMKCKTTFVVQVLLTESLELGLIRQKEN